MRFTTFNGRCANVPNPGIDHSCGCLISAGSGLPVVRARHDVQLFALGHGLQKLSVDSRLHRAADYIKGLVKSAEGADYVTGSRSLQREITQQQ